MTTTFDFSYLTDIPEEEEHESYISDEVMHDLAIMAYVYCTDGAMRMKHSGNSVNYMRQMPDIDIDHYITVYRVMQWGEEEGLYLMPDIVRLMAIGAFLETGARNQMRKQPIDGYVYILRAESGQYKIGRSKNPSDRLKTFSVKLPFRVDYEIVIPSSNHKALERALHERFAAKWINGEWFALSPEDIAALKAEYPND